MQVNKGVIFDVDLRRFEGVFSDEFWEMLMSLERLGWKIMIVTSSNEEDIKEVYRNYDFNYVDFCIANVIDKRKAFEYSLKESNVKLANAFFVGDCQSDIDASNIMGLGSIGLLWIDNPLDNCDFIAIELVDILSFLEPKAMAIRKENLTNLEVTSQVSQPIIKDPKSNMILCRAPYETVNGTYYNYAFICFNCCKLFERERMMAVSDSNKKNIRSLSSPNAQTLLENKGNQRSIKIGEFIYEKFKINININEAPSFLTTEKEWFIQKMHMNFDCPYSCKIDND